MLTTAAASTRGARKPEPRSSVAPIAVDIDLASGASDLKTRDRAWWSDFAWREGRVEIRKTAIRLKLDRDLIAEVSNGTQSGPPIGAQ